MKVWQPSQLFYSDTDSCYFVYNPNNPDHIDPRTAQLPEKVEIGDGLGQWGMELSDGQKWCPIGAKSYVVQCIKEKNYCLTTKGLTVDFNIKDIITFTAMSEIAQVMNAIPKDKQQVLHDKKQWIKDNIKYIQYEPRFGFGYDKNTKDIFTYDSDKIIQNTVGLKIWAKYNIAYPYCDEGEEFTRWLFVK